MSIDELVQLFEKEITQEGKNAMACGWEHYDHTKKKMLEVTLIKIKQLIAPAV